MNLNETIETIQKSAVQAAGAKGKAEVLELPDRKYAIVKGDGTVDVCEHAPPARNHRLRSVLEVPRYVKYATESLSAKPVIYYSSGAVYSVINDSEKSKRSDSVTCVLNWTDEFGQLIQINDSTSPTEFTQREFIRLLRIVFADALPPDGADIIKALRLLNFGASTEGYGRVEKTRESMSRSLESEIRSEAGELPEEIILHVRVFDDPGLRTQIRVRCAIEIDPKTCTFELIPFPQQVKDAVDTALEQVGEILKAGVECPVFYGCP